MSKNFEQLNWIQRCQIEALLQLGTTQKVVARIIKVYPSTISRLS